MRALVLRAIARVRRIIGNPNDVSNGGGSCLLALTLRLGRGFVPSIKRRDPDQQQHARYGEQRTEIKKVYPTDGIDQQSTET